MHPFPSVKKFIATLCSEYDYSSEELAAIEAIEVIDKDINQKQIIWSSNLPTQGKENKDMCLYVQSKTDEVLKDNKSILENIMQIADIVFSNKAGNCQHKTFLAFKLALKYFINTNQATYYNTPALEIKYCNSQGGHFFLVVDGCMVYDPWAQISFPIKLMDEVLKNNEVVEQIYDKKILNYFKLDRNWNCSEVNRAKEYVPSPASTKATFQYPPKYETTANIIGKMGAFSQAPSQSEATRSPPRVKKKMKVQEIEVDQKDCKNNFSAPNSGK